MASMPIQPNFQIVAHRGVRTHADPLRMPPENTLPAFMESAREGVAIELDVIATTDGRLVIHHDDETGRMFSLPDGEKTVRKMTFAQLQNARFNTAGHEASVRKMLGADAFFTTPAPHRNVSIPELAPVLDQLPDTHVYVELKTYDREVRRNDNNQLEQRVARLIREKNLYHRVTVISFSPLSLRRIKQLDPRIPTGLDFEIPRWLRTNRLLLSAFVHLYARHWARVDTLHPSYDSISPTLVHLAHQAGMPIVPWVSGQTRQQEQALFPGLIRMGVDGLITNAVDLLKQAVQTP